MKPTLHTSGEKQSRSAWSGRNVKIERGVPLPPKGKTPERYPWSIMEVGDSFLVEGANPRSHISTGANKLHPDKRFTQRKVQDGIRVWRVK